MQRQLIADTVDWMPKKTSWMPKEANQNADKADWEPKKAT
jgi:hypothetical protein